LEGKLNKHLTDRELEVLRLVIHGYTNNQIGEKLMITHHTVKAHIASILRKLGVKNRLGAALCATEKGIVNLHQD